MAFIRALTLGVIIFPFSALAQGGTAVITGEVHDSTGARVAHAKAELRRERSGVGAISNAADAEGVYNFSGLRADRYTLKLSCPGFLSLTVKSISVVDGEYKSLPPLELAVARGGCGGGPVIEYVRLLPPGVPGGNLGGSVKLDLGPMLGNTPPVSGLK